MANAIVWFRSDLRIADNPALSQALDRDLKPIPVYILDPAEPLGEASAWWLHHSLQSLQQALRATGSDLLIFKGDSRSLLERLARDCKADHIFWNRRYEPPAMARDKHVKDALRGAGLQVESFASSLLREPWQFGKADKTPYRVFTPFWNALQKIGPARAPVAAPVTLPPVSTRGLKPLPVAALGLLGRIPWYQAFSEFHTPGEQAAWQQLEDFFDTAVFDYGRDRDIPSLPATSGLSAHLHFGEISALQIWHHTSQWLTSSAVPGAVSAAEAYLRQIAWREFAAHLLFHFPNTDTRSLDPRYAHFPWQSDYESQLGAWQKGETGIPIVDAGMRELWASGWMHNRVRMISASLLTKNLLVPWQEGAAWFWDTLVDADLANNCFGWQWTAGSGADAAPYFRIFNPVTQGERFDSDGSYVRRWVPELAQLPAKWIHKPWAAPADIRARAGVRLGDNYPAALVELKASRQRALAAWDTIKHRSVEA